MGNRYVEAADEAYRKYMMKDLFTQARVSSTIGRSVDAEILTKCRIGRFIQEANAIKRMPRYSDDEAERHDLINKASDGWKKTNVNVGYADNLALMYFNYYGHGFPSPRFPKGVPWVNEPSKGWVCPKCYVHHGESLDTMEDYCIGRPGVSCGRITPIGEMRRDGVLQRELE